MSDVQRSRLRRVDRTGPGHCAFLRETETIHGTRNSYIHVLKIYTFCGPLPPKPSAAKSRLLPFA